MPTLMQGSRVGAYLIAIADQVVKAVALVSSEQEAVRFAAGKELLHGRRPLIVRCGRKELSGDAPGLGVLFERIAGALVELAAGLFERLRDLVQLSRGSLRETAIEQR